MTDTVGQFLENPYLVPQCKCT